jgi:hypothetical protein
MRVQPGLRQEMVRMDVLALRTGRFLELQKCLSLLSLSGFLIYQKSNIDFECSSTIIYAFQSRCTVNLPIACNQEHCQEF